MTGAARRIGACIAETLHAAGADVVIHYRGSADEANAVSDRLNNVRAGSATTVQADLGDMQSLHALAESARAFKGRLDILINNASSFYPTPLGTITEDHWDDLMASNLKAPLFLTQALAEELKSRSGRIVNIVDIHARRPLKDHLVYGPAKAGLDMLTRSLAKDMAPEVRVNGVSPGAILWPEDGMTEDTQASIVSQVPLARTGEPADIATAVLFLVRDANYATGQVLAIDGGRSIGW